MDLGSKLVFMLKHVIVDTHFRDTFFLQARFMYYVLFYSFKAWPKPMRLIGEIKEVWFRGYESFPFGPFA